MKENSITDFFEKAKSITIIHSGNQIHFQNGDDKFEMVLTSLQNITSNSHEMPAYSVALDDETKTMKNSGLWLELEFWGEQLHGGLPFESLLIEVNSKHSGFNLIRKNNNTYDGRCFYLNLSGDMKSLEQTLQGLID